MSDKLEFTMSDKKLLLRFFQKHNVKVTECADGCRINLDRLDENVKEKYIALVEALETIQAMTRNPI